MGRHTGFFLVALLAGLAVTAIASRTDSLRHPPVAIDEAETTPVFPTVEVAAVSTEPNSTVVLKSLRADSLVIIGSLDSSGAPHPIRITVTAAPGDISRTASKPNVPLHSAVLSQHLASVDLLQGADERDDTILPTPTNEIRQRSFRVPRFEESGTRRELTAASIVSESPRVSVYLEDRLLSEFDATTRFRCDMICELLENQVLSLIHDAIGPISDIDRDGTLAIVIGDIDRQPPTRSHPVRGCVTDQDFQPEGQADFTGDVIYLDRELPEGAALASLLAHELTHAAILSHQMEVTRASDEVQTTDASEAAIRRLPGCRVPSWLNEAAAHWMEHRLISEVPGFAERMSAFKAESALSPVVASDDYLTFTSRRSGSRAAGYLFLKSLLKSEEQLRDFVLNDLPLEQRVERFAGQNYREAFRNWMIECGGIVQATSVGGQDETSMITQMTLHGTAVLCIRLPRGAESVSISSDSKAELEVMTR